MSLAKINKDNLNELIFALNKDEKEWDRRREALFTMLIEEKAIQWFGAFFEKGEEKGGEHYHILICWNEVFKVKPTTFRSRIQKIVGVSNTHYDWKYRVVKNKFTAVSYILKDSFMEFSQNFPPDILSEYSGKWVSESSFKKTRKAKQTKYEEQLSLVDMCTVCVDWERKTPCKSCCFDAVRKYYDCHSRGYDTYRMTVDVRTLYYRNSEYMSELKDIVLEKV